MLSLCMTIQISCRRPGITLERLFSVSNKVTQLLGRTINIRESAAKKFRKRIGEYVDSRNKKDEIQAWPLVKVCKLCHNWQVGVMFVLALSLWIVGGSLHDRMKAPGVCDSGLLKKGAATSIYSGHLSVMFTFAYSKAGSSFIPDEVMSMLTNCDTQMSQGEFSVYRLYCWVPADTCRVCVVLVICAVRTVAVYTDERVGVSSMAACICRDHTQHTI